MFNFYKNLISFLDKLTRNENTWQKAANYINFSSSSRMFSTVKFLLFLGCSPVAPNPAPVGPPPERLCGMKASDIDKYSRVVFPIAFLRKGLKYTRLLKNRKHFANTKPNFFLLLVKEMIEMKRKEIFNPPPSVFI